MANPATFSVLLMYICSAHILLSWDHLRSTNTPPSPCSWTIQLSGDRPIFTTTCWHTNNQSNTTTTRQQVPKQHIHKKPILPTSTIKMEGGSNVLQGYCIRGRVILHDAFISPHSQRRTWYLYHNTTTRTINYWVRKRLGNDAAGKKGRPKFGGNWDFNNQSGGSRNFLCAVATLGINFGTIRSSSNVVFDLVTRQGVRIHFQFLVRCTITCHQRLTMMIFCHWHKSPLGVGRGDRGSWCARGLLARCLAATTRVAGSQILGNDEEEEV
jgi:hypothetical protein